MPGRTLTTLGDYLDLGHEVWAYCSRTYPPPACTGAVRGAPLDLEALARQYGRDLPLSALVERLRCHVCGAPGRISITHDGRPRVHK